MPRTVENTRREAPLSMRLLISWLTNAVVLWVVMVLLSGVKVADVGALLLAAAVFGVLNTVLKPLLRFITLPLALLTFGVAWFFVSLLMLLLTDHLVSGFSHQRLLDARLGDADRVGRQPGPRLHPGAVADHRQAPAPPAALNRTISRVKPWWYARPG